MASVDEEMFYDQLKYRRENIAKNTRSLTKQKYLRLVEEVKYVKALNDPKSGINGKKSARMFWVIKTYDVININNEDRLICPNEKYNGKKFLHYIHDDELFSIIRNLHESGGRHLGRDRMMKEIHQKYKNITRSEVALYLMLCEKCQPKKKKPNTITDLSTKRKYSDIKSCCYINIIPYENSTITTNNNNNDTIIYNYLMVYEDILTNFIILKALKTNDINEICNEISDIFGTFGASTIIKSYNGKEFIDNIIEKLMKIWDGLKLISGNLLNGNINNIHKDIIEMIKLWLKQNPKNNWYESLKYIQFIKNSTINIDSTSSPYERIFGYQPKYGLRSSNIQEKYIKNIKTEKDLDDLIKINGTEEDNDEDDDDDEQNVEGNFESYDIVMKTELDESN